MKTMPLASPHTYRNALRGILSKTLILSGLIAAIYPAQASDISSINRLVRTGQYADALVRTDAVLAQHPRDAQLRFIKGLILAEQNKSAEAIAIFSKLTEDFPDLPEPYNNLAVLYAANGQYDKARSALDMAMRTNPTYATALENLGDVYAKLASQAYDKALQLDPAGNVPPAKLTLVRTLGGNLTGGTIPKLASANISGSKSGNVATPAERAPATAPPVATPPPAPPPVTAPVPEVKPAVKPAPAEIPAEKPSKIDKAAEKAAAKAAKAAQEEARAAKEAAAKAADNNVGEKDKAAILSTVNNWAKAWSDMDVKSYLASYGNDFVPPKGQSRKQWSEERRARIEEKGHINVKVEAPQVTIKNDTATVRFRQIYNSNRLTVDSRKTLILTKQGNRWLIKQERSGG